MLFVVRIMTKVCLFEDMKVPRYFNNM